MREMRRSIIITHSDAIIIHVRECSLIRRAHNPSSFDVPRNSSWHCTSLQVTFTLTFHPVRRSSNCHGNEHAEGDQECGLHLLSSSFSFSESRATSEASGKVAYFYSSVLATCTLPMLSLITLSKVCRPACVSRLALESSRHVPR